jgi:PilZ domain
MAEKRGAPRRKKRIVVDFDTTEAKTTGFTHDLSRTGLFIRTIRIPRIGKVLRAVLHLPDGSQLPIEGTVVRSFRAPSMLGTVLPAGFALKVSPKSPEYDTFAATL